MNNGPDNANGWGQGGNHWPQMSPPAQVPPPGQPGQPYPGQPQAPGSHTSQNAPDAGQQQTAAQQPVAPQQQTAGVPGPPAGQPYVAGQPPVPPRPAGFGAGAPMPPAPSRPPIPSAAWLAGLRAAALAYGLTLAAAVAAIVLLVIGFMIDDSALDYAAPLAGIEVSPSAVLTLLGLPFLLVGMALGGTAAAGSSESMFGFSADVATSMFVLPLALTAVAVIVLWRQGRKAEQAAPLAGTGARWLVSAATGGMFAVTALVLALVFTVRDDGSTVTTAGFSLFLGALSIGLLATWGGRQAASPRPVLQFGPVLRALPETAPAGLLFGLHFAACTLIAGVFLFFAVLFNGSFGALFAAPLWIPTVSAWMYAAMHFSGISAAAGGFGGTGYIFDYPGWAVLLVVLVTLAATVAASVAWLIIRNRIPAPGDVRAWLVLPAVFTAGTLLIQLLTLAAMAGGVGGFGVTAVMGMAWWTFLVMAAWAALIETSSRFLAPRLARVFPAVLRTRLSWLAAKARSESGPVPAAAAQAPAPSATAAPGTAPAPPAAADAGQAAVTTPAATAAAPAAAATGQLPPQPADSGTGTAAAPAVPGTGIPEPAPLSPEARRKLKIGALVGGGAVLLVIAVAVAYNVLAGSVFSPKVQVEKYLDALKNGDAEAAQEMFPVTGDATRAALTNEIYGQAEGRITEYEVMEVSARSDRADVAVTVYRGDESSTMVFNLAANGRTAVLFQDWRIASGPSEWTADLSLPEGQDTITVNGVEVQLDEVDADGYARLALLPGEFVIGAPEGSKYVEYGEDQVVEISPNGYYDIVRFEAGYTDQLAEDVTTQANALLAKCMESTEMEPAGCPNQAYAYRDAEDYRNVSWSLEKEPTYEVTDYYSGEIVFRSSDGEAVVKYEENTAWRDGEEEWEAEEDSVSLYISGEVLLDGDKLTVEFTD